MLRGSSSGIDGENDHANTITAIPQEEQHMKQPRKPFFGPWHDDHGDSGGMGPLGTSGEFATFRVCACRVRACVCV